MGYYAITVREVGSRNPIPLTYGLEYVDRFYQVSYQLGKHDRLWCQIGWTTHYSKNTKVCMNLLTNPQYSYKQVFISFLVNHGPQMLTTSDLMTLFESLGNVCERRYLKPTLLVFLGSPRLAQNGHLGEFCYYSKSSGF